MYVCVFGVRFARQSAICFSASNCSEYFSSLVSVNEHRRYKDALIWGFWLWKLSRKENHTSYASSAQSSVTNHSRDISRVLWNRNQSLHRHKEPLIASILLRTLSSRGAMWKACFVKFATLHDFIPRCLCSSCSKETRRPKTTRKGTNVDRLWTSTRGNFISLVCDERKPISIIQILLFLRLHLIFLSHKPFWIHSNWFDCARDIQRRFPPQAIENSFRVEWYLSYMWFVVP